MNDMQRLLIASEAMRVERFIRLCERERLIAASATPILCCDLCERRAAPGQIYCTDCLHPEDAPAV